MNKRSCRLSHANNMWAASGAVVLLAISASAVHAAPPEHHHYKLIDVGTFGGPESNVIPPDNAGPIISSNGTTVGTSATSVPKSPHSHPFVCGGVDGVVPFVFHGFKVHDGAVTDLGALLPIADNCSEAQGVNNRGEIVLNSENGIIDPLTDINEIRAVVWKDGKIKDLGTFGGNNSQANQINSRGQIAGAASNAIPDPFSIYYLLFLGFSNGTQTRAFLWENGQKQDLGALGTGNDAMATFVNERGHVAGSSYTNAAPNATGFPTIDPFLWTKEKGMIDLGTLGGTIGGPNALNNHDQVIGNSNLVGDQAFDPFLWDNGKLIDLNTGTIGGNPITAHAINDSGEIVGGGAFSTSRPFDAYLWKAGVATDLGTLTGDCSSEAFDINSRGQVVGQSNPCDGSVPRAVLWENGWIVDLNSLIPTESNLQLGVAQAINSRGEIAGNGFPPGCTVDDQCVHAFMLIPCDENHPNIQGCDYSPMEVSTVTASNAAETAPHTKLTSQEISRIRALMNRHRGFKPSTLGSVR